MEHAPHKKEELSIANNVLKLASKLLKVILFCLLFNYNPDLSLHPSSALLFVRATEDDRLNMI